MANIIILGGGFGGVVTAERLAQHLDAEHHITVISRDDRFLFYPALVRYAFGTCEREHISFDLRRAMLNRRVNFIQAEVARVNPHERRVLLAHGEVEGEVTYDYLVFALGRRLATEQTPGFFEHAHHLLTPEAAFKFREAVASFQEGRAVIGGCPGARLPVPVYETAFALARAFEERGERERAQITIVDPEIGSMERLGGREMAEKLDAALKAHAIELVPDFPITRVTEREVRTATGGSLDYDLLMLIPPFVGAGAVLHTGVTDSDGFILVDEHMRVREAGRMYAVGDCVCLPGPKMGHMAVRQAEVAAANLEAELTGRVPAARYAHEVRLVIDEGGADSLYLHRPLEGDDEGTLAQGVFWRWAKRAHETYWRYEHE